MLMPACASPLFLSSNEHVHASACGTLLRLRGAHRMPPFTLLHFLRITKVIEMTEDLSSRKPDSSTTHEHLALIDLLSVRMSYERLTGEMYQRFLEKCRQSKDPVIRAMDLSPLQQFCEPLTEHIHLLMQALDVIGDKGEAAPEERREHFLMLAKSAQAQASDPAVGVFPSMQALLAVEQINEVAWGLLLALMKDAELQRFIAPFEQACTRHRDQRALLQQSYEDVALGLVRRHQMVLRTSKPLRSTLVGRAGLILGRMPCR
jgi:hypothetical protein